MSNKVILKKTKTIADRSGAMECRNHSKNAASQKSQMSRRNIKHVILFLAGLFFMQSCFTTRYVSNEAILMKDFRGATVDDIEFELGMPDKKENLGNGYAYTYYYGRTDRRQMGEMYERYMFDNNDNLRRVQSTHTIPKKYFSPWKTFGVPLTITGGLMIILIVAVASSSE